MQIPAWMTSPWTVTGIGLLGFVVVLFAQEAPESTGGPPPHRDAEQAQAIAAQPAPRAVKRSAAVEPTACQPVTADVQLNATAVFQAGGGLALLTVGGQPRLLKPGQQVLGHQLRRIRPGKLVFEHQGQPRCLLAARRTTSTRSRPTSVRPVGPQRLGTGQYALDRRWLKQRLADKQTLKGVSAKPHLKAGKLAGFTLRRMPKTHVLRELGLKPGDVIVGANGESISSMGQVLKLYDQLLDSNGVSLSLRRRGRPVRLDFAITDPR